MNLDPIIYFASGALLPTIAIFLLRRSQKSHSVAATINNDKTVNNNSDDEEDDDEDDDDLQGVIPDGPSSTWGLMHAPYKMVLCVNTELSMGKGKIAAQCCHAAVGCYKRGMKQCPQGVSAWERTGCAKICVKCPQEDFETIAALAMSKGIPCYLVEDAGRTQIAAGSRTVLGLGPAPVSVFQGVTDHLKLM